MYIVQYAEKRKMLKGKGMSKDDMYDNKCCFLSAQKV